MNPGEFQNGVEGEVSSITMSGTKVVTGSTETGSTISPNELVYDPLKLTNTLLGLRRLSSL